jgi:hypothetical protein
VGRIAVDPGARARLDEPVEPLGKAVGESLLLRLRCFRLRVVSVQTGRQGGLLGFSEPRRERGLFRLGARLQPRLSREGQDDAEQRERGPVAEP